MIDAMDWADWAMGANGLLFSFQIFVARRRRGPMTDVGQTPDADGRSDDLHLSNLAFGRQPT